MPSVTQSYSSNNWQQRERCIRCKGTFELSWVGIEPPRDLYSTCFYVPGACAEYITLLGILSNKDNSGQVCSGESAAIGRDGNVGYGEIKESDIGSGANGTNKASVTVSQHRDFSLLFFLSHESSDSSFSLLIRAAHIAFAVKRDCYYLSSFHRGSFAQITLT